MTDATYSVWPLKHQAPEDIKMHPHSLLWILNVGKTLREPKNNGDQRQVIK